MIKKQANSLALNRIRIEDSFWTGFQQVITDTVIPYQEKILDDRIPDIEKSHALKNFRIAAGLEEGEFYGMVFQDSDVAKWLEGVAYSLVIKPDPQLEQRADAIIEIIEKAQQPDGYLNTYFTIKEPEHRWQNLQECHELYCAGHMMEAAVAYYEATGKDKLLRVMERMAAHIESKFGPDKELGIPGHQEVEIGLMRMYRVTGKEDYLKLAKYFLDQRGVDPTYFAKEKEKRGWVHFGMDVVDMKYTQSHQPVREQSAAEGHSVRAVYMYTAMADVAAESHDQSLYDACVRLWDNMVEKRMYVTGGIGSNAHGEAFTIDYDLPNDSVYAETCASIGLVFFAKHMLDIDPSNKYADIMELELYNGIISGMQLDGKNFFYVNPLEVNPGVSGVINGYKHVLPQRPTWYACACCPPNVVRLLTSLGQYAWSESSDTIYSHLYIGGSAACEKADVTITTQYPWVGRVGYRISSKTQDPFKMAIRIPGWAKGAKLLVNGREAALEAATKQGYVYIERVWGADDALVLTFDMAPRRVYANPAVRADAGCVALKKGPFVYCFEGVDNGEGLQALRVPRDAAIGEAVIGEGLLGGLTALKIDGLRVESDGALYSEQPPTERAQILTAIPYYAWGNRGLNGMRVWMQEK